MAYEKSVLFVCEENSDQSQMAEAFARIHGDNHLNVYSAGSNPSGTVSQRAIRAMTAKDYDLSKHQSKSLQELPDVNFDFLVSMGCGDRCAHIPAQQREDWPLPDPKTLASDEFDKLRDEIENRIFRLLNRLI